MKLKIPADIGTAREVRTDAPGRSERAARMPRLAELFGAATRQVMGVVSKVAPVRRGGTETADPEGGARSRQRESHLRDREEKEASIGFAAGHLSLSPVPHSADPDAVRASPLLESRRSVAAVSGRKDVSVRGDRKGRGAQRSRRVDHGPILSSKPAAPSNHREVAPTAEPWAERPAPSGAREEKAHATGPQVTGPFAKEPGEPKAATAGGRAIAPAAGRRIEPAQLLERLLAAVGLPDGLSEAGREAPAAGATVESPRGEASSPVEASSPSGENRPKPSRPAPVGGPLDPEVSRPRAGQTAGVGVPGTLPSASGPTGPRPTGSPLAPPAFTLPEAPAGVGVEVQAREARIRLESGETGQTEIRIRVTGTVADVLVSGAQARSIAARLPELQTALASYGLNLGQFKEGRDEDSRPPWEDGDPRPPRSPTRRRRRPASAPTPHGAVHVEA